MSDPAQREPPTGDRPRDQETAMHAAVGRHRLVALFGAAALLLNFPLLALWDRDVTVLGLPLFPAALFVLWGGLIVLLGWIVERMPD